MIFFFVHGFILATSLKINSKKLIQLQKTSTKTEVEGSERTWDNGAGEILKRIHIPFYPKNVGRRLITGRENPENCGEVENPENCGLLENLENCGLLENLVNCGVLENLENCEVLETLEFGEVRVRLWVPPCPGLSSTIDILSWVLLPGIATTAERELAVVGGASATLPWEVPPGGVDLRSSAGHPQQRYHHDKHVH